MEEKIVPASPGASRILHLTLHRRWFDAIASGEKKEEYRILKPYWTKRLMSAKPRLPIPYDEIHFRNGYTKDAPFMRVVWLGLVVRLGGKALPLEYQDKHVFCIQLGPILEIRNYKGAA